MSVTGRAAVVLVAVVAMIGVSAGVATAAKVSSFTAPVFPGDFPDPAIVMAGGTYWAYATGSAGRNLQVMNSPDLHNWSAPVDPLAALPSWASSGSTWAPGVIQRGTTWVLYYTVHDTALGRQCISVATSPAPGGPFQDHSAGPLICQVANGGSIDPNPYVDPATGNLVLVWKSDDNALGAGHPTHLWGQPLSADGLSLTSSPTLLLTMTAAWQSPAIEGPTLLREGGRYYLFYGANNYDTAASGIGYAASSSLLGAYADQSVSGPWLSSRRNAQGPQGPATFTDASGTTRLAFAAWYGTVGYENGGVRSLWVGTLGFTKSGTPTIT